MWENLLHKLRDSAKDLANIEDVGQGIEQTMQPLLSRSKIFWIGRLEVRSGDFHATNCPSSK